MSLCHAVYVRCHLTPCSVANLYFLALVIVQVFSIFGAPSPQTAALPLIFILTVTAIKDGIEDYRRALLDEEVNNSAATKLGQWKNVNQPLDPRNWFERTLGINDPNQVTKGVRKLREREAAEGKQQVVLTKADDSRSSYSVQVGPGREDHGFNNGQQLQTIPSSEALHSYPPEAKHASWREVPAVLNQPDYEPTTAQAREASGAVDLSKRVTGTPRWERTLWKKLEVGDIVLLRDNEQIPADIAVLATSDSDNMCYVETKNLDGETNLKPRKAIRGTSSLMSEEDVERISFVLDSEPPHQNLYVYHGVLRYDDPVTGEQKQESVTINELLLRGCTVRNTAWIIGLVVFTGADSKIMLNGGETPSKRSKIEKETNFNVIINFVVLIIMCLVGAIGSGLLDGDGSTSMKKYEQGVDATDSPVVNAIVTFV